MSTTHKHSASLRRNVAWTHFKGGRLDLAPARTTHRAGCLDAFIDFEAQSYHRAPKSGETQPVWCPAYLKSNQANDSKVVADMIAFTLPGLSADCLQHWMIENNLTGLIWPIYIPLTSAASCIVIQLDKTASARVYNKVWKTLAQDLFGNLSDPAQADCRYRFDYPQTHTDQSQLLSYEGHPLDVKSVIVRASELGI